VAAPFASTFYSTTFAGCPHEYLFLFSALASLEKPVCDFGDQSSSQALNLAISLSPLVCRSSYSFCRAAVAAFYGNELRRKRRRKKHLIITIAAAVNHKSK